MTRRLLLLVALGCAFAASTASAQNNSPSTALASALGQVRTVSAAASTSYYYDYYLSANRSYAALCWNESVKAGLTDGVLLRCSVSIRDNADVVVGSTASFLNEPNAVGGSWSTFTPTASGNYVVRATSANNLGGTLRVVMVETTLFSPWFFVSSASGYESYVEIKNTTVRTVNVTVTAFGPNGSQAGTAVARAVPAAGNTFVTVGADIAVGATSSGGVQITFDGPPGAIVANVTTLSGVTGLSFDAPCQPRMYWSLFQ